MQNLYDTFNEILYNTAGREELRTIDQSLEKFSNATDVMVVEDEPMNMLLICEVLKNMGFNTIQASNGKEALEILPLHKPTDDLHGCEYAHHGRLYGHQEYQEYA